VSLKKLHTVVLYSDLSDSKLNYIESTFANTDCYFIKDFFDLYGVITKLELMIMKMLYIQCYSVQEIANVLGITRQAVNQMKNRALRKLKILYVDKLQ
jgi:predicted DNA-binding protein YlxM (UPF0122 family)